jgi:hypothetical protein
MMARRILVVPQTFRETLIQNSTIWAMETMMSRRRRMICLVDQSGREALMVS